MSERSLAHGRTDRHKTPAGIIRPLGRDDRPHLESFPVATSRRHPWTEHIEYLIHNEIPFSIEQGNVSGLGYWVAEQLHGLVVWNQQDPETWRSVVVATRYGMRRKGIGSQLKREMLDLAREEGMLAVVSIVHRDNEPMLSLNRVFGAEIVPDPEDPWQTHMFCAIAL